MFWAVSGKMPGLVTPATFSLEAILGEVTVCVAVITFAVVGVGVFSDHVLALVGGFVGLGLRG